MLNFDHLEGPLTSEVATDGNDRIFGDLGHDWIVGGTGRDYVFGGRGDDLLNVDDVQIVGDANDTPDPNTSYERYRLRRRRTGYHDWQHRWRTNDRLGG